MNVNIKLIIIFGQSNIKRILAPQYCGQIIETSEQYHF